MLTWDEMGGHHSSHKLPWDGGGVTSCREMGGVSQVCRDLVASLVWYRASISVATLENHHTQTTHKHTPHTSTLHLCSQTCVTSDTDMTDVTHKMSGVTHIMTHIMTHMREHMSAKQILVPWLPVVFDISVSDVSVFDISVSHISVFDISVASVRMSHDTRGWLQTNFVELLSVFRPRLAEMAIEIWVICQLTEKLFETSSVR